MKGFRGWKGLGFSAKPCVCRNTIKVIDGRSYAYLTALTVETQE